MIHDLKTREFMITEANHLEGTVNFQRLKTCFAFIAKIKYADKIYVFCSHERVSNNSSLLSFFNKSFAPFSVHNKNQSPLFNLDEDNQYYNLNNSLIKLIKNDKGEELEIDLFFIQDKCTYNQQLPKDNVGINYKSLHEILNKISNEYSVNIIISKRFLCDFEFYEDSEINSNYPGDRRYNVHYDIATETISIDESIEPFSQRKYSDIFYQCDLASLNKANIECIKNTSYTP